MQSGLQKRAQDREGVARRAIGIVQERVKLDGQPSVILRGSDRRDDFGEINGARAGDHVMVHPGRGDIFDMVVADVRGELGNASWKVFTYAEGVADVEVQADRRGVYALGNLEVLIGRLQQQAGLGLDQEQDAELLRVLGQRLQAFDE